MTNTEQTATNESFLLIKWTYCKTVIMMLNKATEKTSVKMTDS